MSQKNGVFVRYKNGFASIVIGDTEIQVAKRTDTSRDYICPVELVSAALGA